MSLPEAKPIAFCLSAAIIAGNCLEKLTASTRRISNQRLAELYALDPFVVIFRVLRKLWEVDNKQRTEEQI